MNFYLIIFSKYPKSNISQWFFNIFTGKSFFWRFFLILQSAPNFFWRHKEFQKRHFGAKAPLLATLLFTIITNHKILCSACVTPRLLFMRAPLYVYLSTLDGVTEIRKVLWKTCLSSKIFYRHLLKIKSKLINFHLVKESPKRNIWFFGNLLKFSVPWKPSNSWLKHFKNSP